MQSKLNKEGGIVRLKNKIAVATGAGSGIGLAAAKLFAKEGATVIILEINKVTGQRAEQSILNEGGRAKFIETDISRHQSVKDAFTIVENSFGRLDILYNNASVFLGKLDGTVVDISPETWDRVLGINLNGLFYCCKYAIPLMIKSGGGSIINTSSSAGIIGVPNCDAYTASKGATITLTRSLAVEYGPFKIRTNCIAPAAIYTPMVRESNLDDPNFNEEEFLRKRTPLRRWGTPEDIANIALFLASDESSYLNGAIIVADGGITIQSNVN